MPNNQLEGSIKAGHFFLTSTTSHIPFGLIALSGAALASVGAKALLVAAVVGVWVSLATVFWIYRLWIGVAVQL